MRWKMFLCRRKVEWKMISLIVCNVGLFGVSLGRIILCDDVSVRACVIWNLMYWERIAPLKYFLIFFIEEQLLYRILFSVIPQHESTIGIFISPPFWTSLPSLPHPTPLVAVYVRKLRQPLYQYKKYLT